MSVFHHGFSCCTVNDNTIMHGEIENKLHMTEQVETTEEVKVMDRKEQDVNEEKDLQKIDHLSSILVEHFTKFHFCVIDNFLGPLLCSFIIDEVNSLFTSVHRTGINKFLNVLDSLVRRAQEKGLNILLHDYKRGHIKVNNKRSQSLFYIRELYAIFQDHQQARESFTRGRG